VSARVRAAGFSLLELTVVIVAVGILVGVVLDRLLPLIGRAERVAFLQVQAELQTALLLEAAELITVGQANRLADLAQRNPMTLFLQAPQNYVGALPSPAAAELPAGTWYYDEQTARLGYRVGRHTRFDALGGPPDRVEFRVAFLYEDRDGDAVFDPSHDRFDGLKLEPTHAFRWPD